MSNLRDNYPIKINNTSLFRPESWKIKEDVVESDFVTEAGTDEVIVTRYGKTTIFAEFACTSTWAATFQGWGQTASLTVQYYDPLTEGYTSKTMRMRNFNMNLHPHSEYITKSMGLYTVTFDLIEF